jgi:G6PDH family F420-dependent oxidoreductase
MVTFGYFLSCEEFGPKELVEQARMAEQAGFSALWISDHYHPWNSEQGQSPFVWSVIGALSEATRLPITTAVTCPTVRIHPAVIAQAAATAAVQLEGRFVLGVGTGEALNEHVLGDRWPPADTRMDMLEEAVGLIRALHQGGEITYRGTHYTVENARIYTLPDERVPIYVSGLGPKAARLAGRIGDGFICTKPDADLVQAFREVGRGPTQAGLKVCHARTEEDGRRTVHRLWPNAALPGELSQILPTPKHFEQASSLVTPDMLPMACGSDPKPFVASVQSYLEAGFDEIYINQIGPEQEQFFRFWDKEIRPALMAPVGS